MGEDAVKPKIPIGPPYPPVPILCDPKATPDPPAEPIEGVGKCPKCGGWHQLLEGVSEAAGEAFENRQ